MPINIKKGRWKVGDTVNPPVITPLDYSIFGYAKEWGVTGGGNTTPIYSSSFSEIKTLMQDSQPRVVIASGIITNPTPSVKGYYANGNKTLIGAPGCEFHGWGLWRYPVDFGSEDNNCIIRNIKFDNMDTDTTTLGDYLTFKDGAKGIWVDHCHFVGGSPGLDGLMDIGQELDGVTLSNNIFTNHSRGVLMGGSRTITTAANVRATLARNHFIDISERSPMFSIGRLHCINNLHEHRTVNYPAGYGQAVRRQAQMHNTNNVFYNYTSHPVRIQLATLDDNGNEWPAGGITGHESNLKINSPGSDQLTSNNPIGYLPSYEYASYTLPADEVLAHVTANAGATLTLAQMGY